MSTVLSLGRRWYAAALPARKRFERNVYKSLNPPTLCHFQQLCHSARAHGTGRVAWLPVARKLWQNNEWTKAEILSELVRYFVEWRERNSPDQTELEALRTWAKVTTKEEFCGKVRGLGPRAYEQLLWYLEGTQAVKLDRHLVSFIDSAVSRPVSEDDKISALRTVATNMGLSPTTLDARIWHYMQSRG